MKRLFFILIVAWAATSCIYPFEMEGNDSVSENIVIGGNIILGDVCTFTMTRMLPLNAGSSAENDIAIPAEFEVEDDMGNSYRAIDGKVDLTAAPTDRRYRLKAKNLLNHKEYASQWQSVPPPCQIDDIEYTVNRDGNRKGTLDFLLSLHGDGDSRRYQILLQEDWEYTSEFRAYYYYIPPTDESLPKEYRKTGKLELFKYGEPNNYFCWKNRDVPTINIITTEGLSEDRVIRHNIHTLWNTDERISYLYCLNVGAMAISEEYYSYLQHIKEVSDYNGSLFSPNPSEMRGNIRCLTDTTEMVTGYIGAGNISRTRIFFDQAKEKFYKAPKSDYELVEVPPADWYSKWLISGMLPVYGDPITGYFWGLKRCVDCTMRGGTKNKPDYWPNDDL